MDYRYIYLIYKADSNNNLEFVYGLKKLESSLLSDDGFSRGRAVENAKSLEDAFACLKNDINFSEKYSYTLNSKYCDNCISRITKQKASSRSILFLILGLVLGFLLFNLFMIFNFFQIN